MEAWPPDENGGYPGPIYLQYCWAWACSSKNQRSLATTGIKMSSTQRRGILNNLAAHRVFDLRYIEDRMVEKHEEPMVGFNTNDAFSILWWNKESRPSSRLALIEHISEFCRPITDDQVGTTLRVKV